MDVSSLLQRARALAALVHEAVRTDRSQPGDERRWRSHPMLAAALRGLVVLIPAVAAFLATTLLAGTVPTPGSWPLRIGWWLVLLAFSTLVATLVQTQSRRLLPLAVLFKLTLLFPDEAPSRYRVARAAANPQQLRDLAQGRTPLAQAATLVLAWVGQLSRHDRHTRGHSERVRVFADLIAEQLPITGLDREKLRWAALLHDIGKLQVPATVLNKPGKPTEDEWETLRRHPATGLRLVGPLTTWLGPWAGGIGDHHEHFDGTGYPRGLRSEEISLAGRIVAVADAYETMTAARAYKRPMVAAAAREELARCAGTHFDPLIVRAFLSVGLPRMLYSIGPISFLLHLPFLSRVPDVGLSLLSAASTATAPVAAGLTAASFATASVAAPVATISGDRIPATGGSHVAATAIGTALVRTAVTGLSSTSWKAAVPSATGTSRPTSSPTSGGAGGHKVTGNSPTTSRAEATSPAAGSGAGNAGTDATRTGSGTVGGSSGTTRSGSGSGGTSTSGTSTSGGTSTGGTSTSGGTSTGGTSTGGTSTSKGTNPGKHVGWGNGSGGPTSSPATTTSSGNGSTSKDSGSTSTTTKG